MSAHLPRLWRALVSFPPLHFPLKSPCGNSRMDFVQLKSGTANLSYRYFLRVLHTISFVSHNTQGIATATIACVGHPARIEITAAAVESPRRVLSDLSRARAPNIVLSHNRQEGCLPCHSISVV